MADWDQVRWQWADSFPPGIIRLDRRCRNILFRNLLTGTSKYVYMSDFRGCQTTGFRTIEFFVWFTTLSTSTFRKQTIVQLVDKISAYDGTHNFIIVLTKSGNRPYSEPDKSTPNSPLYVFKINFIIIFPSTAWYFKCFLCFRRLPPNACTCFCSFLYLLISVPFIWTLKNMTRVQTLKTPFYTQSFLQPLTTSSTCANNLLSNPF
jgi:hypothetical protein